MLSKVEKLAVLDKEIEQLDRMIDFNRKQTEGYINKLDVLRDCRDALSPTQASKKSGEHKTLRKLANPSPTDVKV